MKQQSTIFAILVFTIISFPISGCKKFIEVGPPDNTLADANVYQSDKTAAAVLTDIYASMSEGNSFLGQSGSLPAVTVYTALSSDELTLFNLNDQLLNSYYLNDLRSTLNEAYNLWNNIYPVIFVCNAAIQGIGKSDALTVGIQRRLLGEAKFIRAFCYFYLVNLYGDVPLVLTTDYRENAKEPRATMSQVYEQIIADLKEAQNLLDFTYVSSDASTPTFERVRPNKAAATALLARAYLYTGDWANAESESTTLINYSEAYELLPLDEVFVKNSRETIWALQPVGHNEYRNSGEGKLFVLDANGPDAFFHPVYLSEFLYNSFESGDSRKTKWTDTVEIRDGSATLIAIYPFARKYKVGFENVETKEYPVILRLAEQYLIRAESRAHQENISGSQADLNTIRLRSDLPVTTANTSQEILDAVFHERQVELFTEWAHRWLDLQRTGKINDVMQNVATVKGVTWEPFKARYPIPQTEINRNPGLQGHQNPGY